MDIGSKGKITSLSVKSKKLTGLANGGVYLIDPLTLDLLGIVSGDNASLEEQLLPNLMTNGGELFGQECEGRFIDIGLPQDYFRASEILPTA